MEDNQPLIVVADDDDEALFGLEQVLRHAGYRVVTAPNGDSAFRVALERQPELILLDVNMPVLDGYLTTKKIKEHSELKYVPVILLTGKDSAAEIVYGLDQGADDYISKPFNTEELLSRIKAALRTLKLYRSLAEADRCNQQLRQVLKERSSFSELVGKSIKIQQAYTIIEKVATSDAPVMIIGESGVGKELAARAVHFSSDRKDGPFIVQNCSAFSDTLLESELFGHVKGAFTGAIRDKPGMFEEANGGTFFLDELGEMSQNLQAKLLRVVQEKVFTPVGATKTRKVDVRIVSATHRNLPDLIKQGSFREDLFYRLNLVTVYLPSLRERRDDIPLLADHFLGKLSAKRRSNRQDRPQRLSKDVLHIFSEYSWPGNIRQLQNEIERMVLLSDGEDELNTELVAAAILAAVAKGSTLADVNEVIGSDSEAEILQRIPLKSPSSPTESPSEDVNPKSLKEALESLERKMILGALNKTHGNKSEAARELGISRSNLIAKAQIYDGFSSDLQSKDGN